MWKYNEQKKKGAIVIRETPERFKLEDTTIWSFPERGNWATHSGKYRGNWSPYIPRNIILRYSKKKDWILDQFLGSGTTLIEAKLLGRNAIGVDINSEAVKLSNTNLNFTCQEKSKIFTKQGNANNLSFIKDESIDLLGIDPKWPYINRPGCVFCFTKTFYNSIKDKWNTKYPHDAILWRFARMDHALGLFNYPVIEFRRHGDNATSEENRTKESRIQTFDDYIRFHEMGLERVTSENDKEMLKKGIEFLELRRRFFETGNIALWIKLASKYRAFYN